jgi:hypothetical protein
MIIGQLQSKPFPPGATLLIDETDGRATAAAAPVPFIGVLGILGHCKRRRSCRRRCVHFWIAFAGNWAFELRSGSTGSF